MSTSYTTNGRPVPASADFGQAESDAVSRGATGAGAAERPEETTVAAFSFVGNSAQAGGAGEPTRILARCGPWCWIIGGILILVAIDALASSGGGS